jgi:hypothetical protein
MCLFVDTNWNIQTLCGVVLIELFYTLFSIINSGDVWGGGWERGKETVIYFKTKD